jgi:hypothetical protein
MDSKSTRLYEQTQLKADTFVSYSNITGNKYSLIAEGIYEKKIKNGILTGGLKHTQSYTENNYTGDVTNLVGLVVAETWGHAEFQLRKNKFNYMLGLGMRRTFTAQDGNSLEKYIFTPKATVVYAINKNAYVRYSGYLSGYPPALSAMNNVTQNIDALQVQQGNPTLKMVWYYDNSITAGYKKGLVSADLYTQYFYVHQPAMEQTVFADTVFVHTVINQKAYHHIYSELSIKLKPFKNYITLNIAPSFDRYMMEGNNYAHAYNNWRIRFSLTAMYKNWIFAADGNTRRNNFQGETLSKENPPMITLMAGYNTQKWSLLMVLANPFTKEYKRATVNYSALTPYISSAYTNSYGQVIAFKFRFNLSFGRNYNASDKRLDNKDTDSGIMKGEKK